jgi:hypothetical protein
MRCPSDRELVQSRLDRALARYRENPNLVTAEVLQLWKDELRIMNDEERMSDEIRPTFPPRLCVGRGPLVPGQPSGLYQPDPVRDVLDHITRRENPLR